MKPHFTPVGNAPPSPPAPFLPPLAVSSREISASDLERRRWRIPSLSLFSPFFWPSFRQLSARTGHSSEPASYTLRMNRAWPALARAVPPPNGKLRLNVEDMLLAR